jgi:hypothetical protein
MALIAFLVLSSTAAPTSGSTGTAQPEYLVSSVPNGKDIRPRLLWAD